MVAGFEPVMPTFQGLVTEEQVVQLVEYVKSLGPKPGTGPADTGAEAGHARTPRAAPPAQSLEPYDYRSRSKNANIT